VREGGNHDQISKFSKLTKFQRGMFDRRNMKADEGESFWAGLTGFA
jgi:hypothetical protein